MKLTIDIDDRLHRAAKQKAARDGTTLRALVEQGLKQVVAKPEPRKEPFKLRDASVGGQGLTDEMKDAKWEKWLELIYDGR